jgi:hypothetical protein
VSVVFLLLLLFKYSSLVVIEVCDGFNATKDESEDELEDEPEELLFALGASSLCALIVLTLAKVVANKPALSIPATIGPAIGPSSPKLLLQIDTIPLANEIQALASSHFFCLLKDSFLASYLAFSFSSSNLVRCSSVTFILLIRSSSAS